MNTSSNDFFFKDSVKILCLSCAQCCVCYQKAHRIFFCRACRCRFIRHLASVPIWIQYWNLLRIQRPIKVNHSKIVCVCVQSVIDIDTKPKLLLLFFINFCVYHYLYNCAVLKTLYIFLFIYPKQHLRVWKSKKNTKINFNCDLLIECVDEFFFFK